MDVRQTRLDWLRHLIAIEPGPERGAKARFATKIGKAPAQISQWLGGSRTIDDETARAIEARLGFERWCIDRPIATAQAHQQVEGFGQEAAAAAPAAPVAPRLDAALPVVLDALARAPQREKLRTALLAVLEDDDPAYRQRLSELLAVMPPDAPDDPDGPNLTPQDREDARRLQDAAQAAAAHPIKPRGRTQV